MRVAIISDSLDLGGAERQAVYTARTVAGLGCETELIYYRPSAIEFAADDIAPGRRVYLPRRGGPLGNLYRLSRYLRAGRFDVVHGFKGIPAAYACSAGRWAGVPVLLAGYREPLNQSARRNQWLMRAVKRVAHGWIVNAAHIKRTLVEGLQVDPEHVHVINNGIELSRWTDRLSPADAKRRLGFGPGDQLIGIVARLRLEKDHASLIAAMARVNRDRERSHLLLVGDGPLEADLQAQVRALGLADAVHFLGNRTDVPDILAALDVSVIISRYEGLSNALLESMAAGVAVITTAYPGVEELIEDGRDGMLTPFADPAVLADRLLALLGDEERRVALARAGQAKVSAQFSTARMGRRMLDVYEQYLRRRIGGRR